MEHKKEYKKISVICHHTNLAQGVMEVLMPYSNDTLLLLGNKNPNKDSDKPNKILAEKVGLKKEEATLSDIVLTTSQLDGSDLVVYIDDMGWHLKEESQMMSRLNALANVVNCCIDLQNVKFVFVSPFTPMFGRHFSTVINENTIWESSMDLDLPSKYINLAEQEVFRGLNDGLKCTIVSCGFNADTSNGINNKEYIKDLLQLKRPSYQFVDHRDIYSILEKVINDDQCPEKLLLIDTSKSRIELEVLINYKPDIFDKITSWIKPKKITNTEIVINNSKTKDWYQHPFTSIQSFFNQNNN